MDIRKLRQEVMEDTYSRTNRRQWIIKEIQQTQEIKDLIAEIAFDAEDWIDHPASYKSLESIKEQLRNQAEIRIILHNCIYEMFICVLQDNRPKTIQQVVGVGAKELEYYLQDTLQALKLTSEILGLMCSKDLIDIDTATYGDTDYAMVYTQYDLPEELLEKMAQTKYMPPMIVRPNHVWENRDNAYLTFKSSMILGDKHNYHENKISLDVINIQNSIPLTLNKEILNIEEESKKPLDTPEKIRNFYTMQKASRTVYESILENGNVFYNTHAFDMRGRLYSQGYYVHIQSTEYKKSLIDFVYQETISHEVQDATI